MASVCPLMRAARDTLVLGLLVALSACGGDLSDAERVLRWSEGQSLGRGEERSLTLPGELKNLSVSGRVVALKSSDGRLCVLVKRLEDARGNFKGLLVCDSPVSEFYGSATPGLTGRETIRLTDFGDLSYLTVSKRYNERTFLVYFNEN